MRITALPCLCVDVFDGTDEIRPGGEELNFAVHAARFENMEVVLLGAIGKDRYGEAILKSIEGMNIDRRYICIDEHHTTANNMTYLTDEGDRYYKDNSWNGEILDAFSLTDNEIDIIRNSDVVFTHY
ncbi:MAG: carbohydrate kinase family protein, partial [Lachnospiraceae bacterium]